MSYDDGYVDDDDIDDFDNILDDDDDDDGDDNEDDEDDDATPVDGRQVADVQCLPPLKTLTGSHTSILHYFTTLLHSYVTMLPPYYLTTFYLLLLTLLQWDRILVEGWAAVRPSDVW